MDVISVPYDQENRTPLAEPVGWLANILIE
jgi:hypothetical protein